MFPLTQTHTPTWKGMVRLRWSPRKNSRPWLLPPSTGTDIKPLLPPTPWAPALPISLLNYINSFVFPCPDSPGILRSAHHNAASPTLHGCHHLKTKPKALSRHGGTFALSFFWAPAEHTAWTLPACSQMPLVLCMFKPFHDVTSLRRRDKGRQWLRRFCQVQLSDFPGPSPSSVSLPRSTPTTRAADTQTRQTRPLLPELSHFLHLPPGPLL